LPKIKQGVKSFKNQKGVNPGSVISPHGIKYYPPEKYGETMVEAGS
jgi:hypothetical protein